MSVKYGSVSVTLVEIKLYLHLQICASQVHYFLHQFPFSVVNLNPFLCKACNAKSKSCVPVNSWLQMKKDYGLLMNFKKCLPENVKSI